MAVGLNEWSCGLLAKSCTQGAFDPFMPFSCGRLDSVLKDSVCGELMFRRIRTTANWDCGELEVWLIWTAAVMEAT